LKKSDKNVETKTDKNVEIMDKMLKKN